MTDYFRGSWLDRLLNWLLGSSEKQVHRRLKNRGWYDG